MNSFSFLWLLLIFLFSTKGVFHYGAVHYWVGQHDWTTIPNARLLKQIVKFMVYERVILLCFPRENSLCLWMICLLGKIVCFNNNKKENHLNCKRYSREILFPIYFFFSSQEIHLSFRFFRQFFFRMISCQSYNKNSHKRFVRNSNFFFEWSSSEILSKTSIPSWTRFKWDFSML